MTSTIGPALHAAASRLRATLADPTASLALVVPASTNGVLARQAMQRAGGFIRIRAVTPEQILHQLARLPLARRGLRAPPPGWLELTLARRLPDLGLPDGLGETLTQPGWIPALASTTTRLERAGVDADAVSSTPPSANRTVLRAVLADVRAQRDDHGYAGPVEVLTAAYEALKSGSSTPVNRLRGAIVLGDRVMPPDTHAILTAWLAERPTEVLLPAPLDALEPASRGLRRAAGDASVTVFAPNAASALGKVRRRLWRTPDGVAAPDDGTVTLARTPDEHREVAEAVRVVRRAVQAGTPLDRIAIVVPDASQSDIVRETLRRASLPATLLVGPPVTTGPSGSFLRLALDIAAGQDDVSTWHALLTTPALRLGRALGEGASAGRGRWRRMLSRCGASSNAGRIRQGLARLGEDADGARDPEADRTALASLDAAIGALDTALRDLRTPRSLGGFARACALFLERWGARSQEGAMLQAVLKSLGVGGQAVPFPLARQELLRLLDGTPQLQGTLSDRAIVVATPMAMLGGDFELVCIVGLAHGRLPGKFQSDALLPDTLIEALNTQGHSLLPSTALASREPRRLGAAISASTGSLWLSAPAFEMMKGRPTLPSALLLDVATALSGEHVGFGALEKRFVRAGSRHRAFAVDPADALSAAEHRTARAWNDPLAALSWLLANPAALRVVMHLLHGEDEAPSAWTGAVPTDLIEVPGLAAPTSAKAVERLLANPEMFFLRDVLGAWPPRPLPGPVDVFGDLNLHLLGALRRAVADGTTDQAGLLAAWEAEVREQRPLDAVNASEVDVGRSLAMRRLAPLVDGGLDLTEVQPLEGGEVAGWHITGTRGFEAPGEVNEFILKKAPSRNKALQERAASFIHAMAEGRADTDQLRFRSLKQGDVRVPIGEVRPVLSQMLLAARVLANVGWYPDRKLGDAIESLRTAAPPHTGPAAIGEEAP